MTPDVKLEERERLATLLEELADELILEISKFAYENMLRAAALLRERTPTVEAATTEPVAGRGLTAAEAAAYRAIRRRLFRVLEDGVLACSHPSGDSCIEENEPTDAVCNACAVEGGANAIHNLEGFLTYRAAPTESEKK